MADITVNHMIEIEVFCSDCGAALEFFTKKHFEDIYVHVDKCLVCFPEPEDE